MTINSTGVRALARRTGLTPLQACLAARYAGTTEIGTYNPDLLTLTPKPRPVFDFSSFLKGF